MNPTSADLLVSLLSLCVKQKKCLKICGFQPGGDRTALMQQHGDCEPL